MPLKKRKYEPVQKEITTSPKSRKVEVEEDMIMGDSLAIQESGAPMDFGLEEVEIDENNPEDSWYDPSEWEVVERTMPDGTKKRYRVRMLTQGSVPTSPETMQVPVLEEEVIETWDFKTLKASPSVPCNLFVDEPFMQMEQHDMDEAYPEVYDPNDWQITEVLTPDGKTKQVRRRIVLMRINVVPKKPSDPVNDEPIGVLEEVAFDEYVPEEDEDDASSWQVAEKVLPNGEKQVVRRRVIVNKVKFVTKKPSEIPKDEPLAIVEEVELDPANPEPFDPIEWEVVEKELPDGTIKPIRRRVCVNLLRFVPKPVEEVDQNLSHVAVEEVDAVPGDQFNEAEWDTVEKKLPNDEVQTVHRRLAVARYRVYNMKPSEVDANEPLVELEEVRKQYTNSNTS